MSCLGQDVVDSLDSGDNACSIYTIRRLLLLRNTGVPEKKSLMQNARKTLRNAVCLLASSSYSGHLLSQKGQSLVSAVIPFTQHFTTIVQCTNDAARKILIT